MTGPDVPAAGSIAHPPVRGLHHVAILTRSIEASIAYYRRLLGVPQPIIRQVDRPGIRLRTAMLATGPAANTFLQLIEPDIGPGVAELESGGDGTIYELAFEVEGIVLTAEAFRADGIVPIDLLGSPISDGFLVAASGMRYLYLPVSATRGTRTELVEPAGPAPASDR